MAEYKKLSDLPVGSKFRFGRLNAKGDAPIEWVVASKNHHLKDSGYPTNAVTAVTSRVINFMAFDAKEPFNALKTRKDFGNNRYRLSNIRQWLNSDKGANEWFIEQNITGEFHYNDRDTPPNQDNIDYEVGHFPYQDVRGFLSMFKDYEKTLIMKTKVRTATNPEYDYSSTASNYDETNDSFFLLSNAEVGLGNNGNVAEGFVYDYFLSNPRTAYATEDSYDNSPYSTSNGYMAGFRLESKYPYTLRSPILSNGGLVSIVDTDGDLGDITCSNFSGLRIGTNLSADTLISLVPDDKGVYIVQTDLKPVVEVNTSSLFDVHMSLQDSLNVTDKIKLKLNNNEVETLTIDAKRSYVSSLPFSLVKSGINILEIECFSGINSLNKQTFNIKLEKNQIVTQGDTLSTKHGLYDITKVTENDDGTLTVQLNKNLIAGVYKGETIEKMLFNYQPSAFITDNPSGVENFQDMTLNSIKYNPDKSYATEEWVLVGSGVYCTTKVKMKRSSIHEDVSVSRVKQFFNYKNESY